MTFPKKWVWIRVAAAVGALAAITGEASASALTWDYTGGVALIGTGSQPVTFTADGEDTLASAFTFVNSGGTLTLTGRNLLRNPLTGISVCNNVLESNAGCAQIDRIGLNDVMRIELPSADWEVDEVVVGIVTRIASLLDAFVLYGSNDAIPAVIGDLTPLLSGNIADLGSSLGLGFWDVPIGASSGYQYLFFTTTANNDGYSLASLTAQIDPHTFATPEPATLALFGAGVAGLGATRRRRKSAK